MYKQYKKKNIPEGGLLAGEGRRLGLREGMGEVREGGGAIEGRGEGGMIKDEEEGEGTGDRTEAEGSVGGLCRKGEEEDVRLGEGEMTGDGTGDTIALEAIPSA